MRRIKVGVYSNNLKISLDYSVMNKYLYVCRASMYHFRKGFETLFEGFKDPDKFQKEDREQTELMAKLFPVMVYLSMNHKPYG
jgi:hypothetical protein